MKEKFDYLIVGAGPSGIVLAERLSSMGKKILIIEKRDHIAGNCYDYLDENNLLIHKYGPHYFRAKSKEIVDYLSNFTEWIPHRYKVKANINGKLYSFPINKKTIEQFFNKKFSSEEEVKNFIDSIRDKNIENPKNAEEQVISMIGKEIYEAFFKGYTQKQWGIDPKKLDASVTARIPIRHNDNDDYIMEEFQAMPKEGYTKMFEKMLNNKNITLKLNTPFSKELKKKAKKIIWTGPIDQYYNFKYGRLPYRSLDFKFKTFLSLSCKPFFQEEGQINYPSLNVPHTRIVEIKHVTHQKNPFTKIAIETPSDRGEPYYPIPTKEAKEIYNKYLNESKKEKNVFFIGRLARYKYLNTDQCVEEALELFKSLSLID